MARFEGSRDPGTREPCNALWECLWFRKSLKSIPWDCSERTCCPLGATWASPVMGLHIHPWHLGPHRPLLEWICASAPGPWGRHGFPQGGFAHPPPAPGGSMGFPGGGFAHSSLALGDPWVMYEVERPFGRCMVLWPSRDACINPVPALSFGNFALQKPQGTNSLQKSALRVCVLLKIEDGC